MGYKFADQLIAHCKEMSCSCEECFARKACNTFEPTMLPYEKSYGSLLDMELMIGDDPYFNPSDLEAKDLKIADEIWNMLDDIRAMDDNDMQECFGFKEVSLEDIIIFHDPEELLTKYRPWRKLQNEKIIYAKNIFEKARANFEQAVKPLEQMGYKYHVTVSYEPPIVKKNANPFFAVGKRITCRDNVEAMRILAHMESETDIKWSNGDSPVAGLNTFPVEVKYPIDICITTTGMVMGYYLYEFVDPESRVEASEVLSRYKQS